MMHTTVFGSTASNRAHSGYLKVEEGKNHWMEYWVVIRDNHMSLFSDECSDESGEEAIKTIELSCETRCELVKRRNYHYRFKLLLGSMSPPLRLKCSSAFHRQQWISHIMLASAKDRVIELNSSFNSERDGVHRRTLSTESQLSSDAESLGGEFDSGLESTGALSDSGGMTHKTTTTLESGQKSPVNSASVGRRGSKGLLRRLSFKASSRLRRNSKASPKDESNFSDMTSPSSPATPSRQHTETNASPIIDQKVFVNPAFVPSPTSSPKMSRHNCGTQEVDLIDMSDS